MALPKEPRQKMINLMYLVLTALLALNVSAEILNAFKTVNTSLVTANGIIDKKNSDIFASLEKMENDSATAERARKWAPLAKNAGDLTTNAITYIHSLQDLLKKESDGEPDGSYKYDELEAPTRLMVEEKRGDTLRQHLIDFKNQLLALDPAIAKQFSNILPIDTTTPNSDNSENNDWKSTYFRMVPTVAAVTILSKFENDIKNSEAMVVDFCQRQVGQVQFVDNTYVPLVGQSSNYLMPGQELTITAGIGAFNNASKPQVTVDGASVPLDANGVAQYKTTVSSTGTKKVVVSFFNQSTGKMDSRPFDVQYTVGSPTGASVSADDVKVLYISLDNHLSVNGGSVGDEKVHVSIDNGSLDKTGPGKYIAHPSKSGKAQITMNVEGKPSQTFEFRVKTVPDPDAKVGASGGGHMRVNDFKAQFGVRADLENFIFEGVKFTVTSYTIYLTGAGFPSPQFRTVNGASFDPVRDLIEKTKPGTTVVIDDIRASGPSGNVALTPIVFNLN